MTESKHPPQAFIANQHPFAAGQSMCTAMPHRFVRNPTSKMHALSGVVCGATPAVTAAFAYIGILKLSFVVGGATAACLLCRPRASLVSSSISCLLAAVGWSGFYEGHNLLNRQRLPTAAGVYQFVVGYIMY